MNKLHRYKKDNLGGTPTVRPGDCREWRETEEDSPGLTSHYAEGHISAIAPSALPLRSLRPMQKERNSQR